MNKYNIFAAIGTLLIVALYGLVGHQDFQDSQILQDGLCEMVEAGYYPAEMCRKVPEK